jgi:serine/threonine-protein kinase HipA
MGALRFQEDGRSGFLNSDEHLATPPLTSLRELEHASLMFEKDETGRDDDALKWIDQLLAPGSSLGGARPKAGVVDDQGSLWIAKFPSQRDGVDVGAWEAVINELARQAGLRVPEAQVQRLTQKRRTYLSRRFDRLPTGERIHFASAMTLLGYADGADAAAGVSYLDLAEFIMRNGAAVTEDLAELWRRIVFNICVSNTDDHLRNHGFLLAPNEGWRLAPAYDMNPNPQGKGLTLNIAGNDNRLDLDLALEVANSFRLTLSDAERQMAVIRGAVGQWRLMAAQKRLSKTEQDDMASAFQRVAADR